MAMNDRQVWENHVYPAHVISENAVCSVLSLCDPMKPNRFLCPWDFPDKNTGVGCHYDFKVYVISFGYIILSKVVLCPFPFCFRSKLL